MNGFNSEQPVSLGEWIVTYLLLCIPCVGLIMMLVWGFGGGAKPSKRNYCRAMLLISVIITILMIVMIVFTLIFGEISVNY